MWKLTIEDEQGSSTVVPLVRHEYTLGRTEENSIRLTERNVSRKHATLRKKDGSWFLVDQTSYNGCFVNGARIAEPTALGPRDLIQIADYRLELDTDDQRDLAASGDNPKLSDTLSNTPQSLAAQCDRLVMVMGPTPGREFLLGRSRQTIGRGEECDICVNHASVSRRHAEIPHVGQSRYELIDQGSSNGLSINGALLSRGLLDAHDLVELGDIVLKFIPAGEIYRPSAEENEKLAALLGVDEDGTPRPFWERTRAALSTIAPPARYGILGLALVVLVLFVVAAVKGPGGLPSAARPVVTTTLGAEPGRSPLASAQAFRDPGDGNSANELVGTPAPGASEHAVAPAALEGDGATLGALPRNRRSDAVVAASPSPSEVSTTPDAPAVESAPVTPRKTTKAAAKPSANPAAQAISGSQKDAIAAKEALRAKVKAGTATDRDKRLLRVLCRQLGDTSCTH